jgi:small basic protein (TIGR04137 family)
MPLLPLSGVTMSIDKSLRRKNSLARARSVLRRDERIKTLIETDKWTDGRSPYGLPKVRVLKIVKKKAPKEKAAEAAPGAEGAAAPAAAAAPAEKGGGKGKK